MATCRDCFHWEACKAMFEASGGIIVADDFKGSAVRCKNFVSAADVAPRAEVAREIFEEIEKCMLHDLIPSIGVYKGSLELRIAELRKKYTEAETAPPEESKR